MPTIASYGFESGSNGDALTTTNGNCDSVLVAGGSAAISTTQFRSGTRSCHMTATSSSGQVCLTKNIATGTTSISPQTFSIYWVTRPSAEITIFAPRDTSSGQSWFLNCNGSGRLRLYDSTGASVWLANSGTPALSAGKWYDITVSGDVSATAGTLRVYAVDVAASTTIVDSNDGSTGVWTGTNGALNTGSVNIGSYRLGIKCGVSTATGEAYLDDYATTYSLPAAVVNGIAATILVDTPIPGVNGEIAVTGSGPAAITLAAVAPAVSATSAGPVVAATGFLAAVAPSVSATSSPVVMPVAVGVNVSAPVPQIHYDTIVRATGGVAQVALSILPPSAPEVSGTAVYLYTPPVWRMPIYMGGSMVVGVPTPTLVWRQNGVWHNQSDQGVDSPRIADVDVDPLTGLRLFFTKPMVVPGHLHDELAQLQPADPSWTPGSLILL